MNERARALELPLIGLAWVAALALGVAGFAELRPADSTTDVLYATLQLFVLDADDLGGDVPLALDIARFLAPVVAAYAAVRAFVSVFRRQVQTAGVRLLRRHAVVVGLGEKGYALARAYRAANGRAVAVERDPSKPAVSGCRARGIPVLVDDGSDPDVLRRAGAERAAELVVTAGDDAACLDVAFAARALHRPATRPLPVVVHIEDPALWLSLRTHGVLQADDANVRVEPFNVVELAARALLERHPPFDGGAGRIALVGTDPIGARMVLHAARLWGAAGNGGRLRVTVACPGAPRACAALVADHPRLEELAEFEAVDAEPDSRRLRDAIFGPGDDAPLGAVYICLESQADTVALALALEPLATARGVPIVATAAHGNSPLVDELERRSADGPIRVFDVLAEALDPAALRLSTNERLARANHDYYLAERLSDGDRPAGSESLVPWDRLPEHLKRSNRSFADGIGPKLERTRCTIVPSPLADPARPSFSFSRDEVELLAELEHERWCEHLRREGWRRGNTRDAARREHPDLVPWGELPHAAREKDRQAVAALPAILAHAGFEIERL